MKYLALALLLSLGCTQAELTPVEQVRSLYAAHGITVTVRIETGGFHCEADMWGYYDRAYDVITVCDVDHPGLVTILVHEIAHSLDAEYLSDADRQVLLKEWGLSVWYGGTAWLERGAEWFAESVTLSLIPDAKVKIRAESGLEVLLRSMRLLTGE